MLLRIAVRALLSLAFALLAACAAQPGPAPLATLPPSPTAASAAPTMTPPALITSPTAASAAPTTAPPALTTSPTAAVLASGDATDPYAGIPRSRTPEGYHVLGNPDAPVTLVMYSDFL